VLFLESAGQIYPETGLTFEAQKSVLASVISGITLNQGRLNGKYYIYSCYAQ
jgi:hypothetical protein